MAPRPSAAIVVGCVVCAALAGCGGGGTADRTTPATPSQYIDAVERLVEPPGQLASSIAESRTATTTPSTTRAARIVAVARLRLAEFRALRLADPVLRRQRDRLAGAYARMVPQMRAVADALASGDRGRVGSTARPFLDSLDGLPSAAASPASR